MIELLKFIFIYNSINFLKKDHKKFFMSTKNTTNTLILMA